MSAKDNSYLTGQLLVAMPGMGDPRFHKAVIYLCSHDARGAMGLVVNHVIPGMTFGQLLKQFDLGSPDTLTPDIAMHSVICGGPVEPARGFMLHGKDFTVADTLSVDRTFSLSGTLAALKAVANGRGPADLVFILGYAGWGEGQLEHEIQDNAWLTAQATEEILFRTEPDMMWEKAVTSMGVKPAMLSSSAGHA